MISKIILRSVVFSSVLMMAAAMISCGGTRKDAFITFYTGSVSLVRDGSPVALQIKSVVKDGDAIRTGDKSCLVVQTADGLIVRVESNTEASFSSITNVNAREISIHRGKVLSLVGKLRKSEAYTIKTPTTIAAVRGTQFLTEYNGKDSVVAVGDGLVSVKRTAGVPDEKLVEKGKSAVTEGPGVTTEIRNTNSVENLELQKLSTVPMINKVEEKKPEEIKALYTETAAKDEKINDSLRDETGLTPEEMKTKYGRIDILSLYDGRVVKGVIVSRGQVFKVLTSGSPVFIDAKDIRDTDVK
jgi:hypothetical protein